jgi:multidrug efflux pump subunit AcrA (membrane-fusion protein)
VTVAKPVMRAVADQDEYVGRFVAVDAIEVRARVSGYLEAIHFKDGQLVKKGDLLFTIDRRPFEASLAQTQANLSQARANLAYAVADLERGQGLVRGSTITQQTFDQRTQAKGVAEASVKPRKRRAPGHARSRVHRAARAGLGTDRRPARLRRQPRDGRHDRHHDAARHHHVDRPHPLRSSPWMRRRTCDTCASRRHHRRSQTAASTCR